MGMRFLLPALLALSSAILQVAQGNPPANSIPMKIVNNAGAPVEVFWIDSFKNDGTIVKQTTKPMRNGTDTNINSYNTHEFVAKFANSRNGDAEAFFTKGPSEEKIIITYDEAEDEMSVKQVTKFNEIMDLIGEASEECKDLVGDAFSTCVADKVLQEVERLKETAQEIRKYRDLMSPRLREYICSDLKPNMSEPILKTATVKVGQSTHRIEQYVDTDRSKVWVVRNAISPKECASLEKLSTAASPVTLSETAVDGTAVLGTPSSGIASYALDEDFPQQDKLWPLYERIYKIASTHAKLNLTTAGQEGFELATYTGDGYGPQCDGGCSEARLHKAGDRVASVSLFCQVAEQGGIFTFPRSDVILQPSLGMAVFYTYVDPDTATMDDGFAQHSMCPVTKGSQQVVTLKMRRGVDAEHPWHSFEISASPVQA
ncbi:hypothetical protein B484DRAFT_457280 [Ochromonadaceae sp. CCMP2298]|nr:hypothetical protein B484DRAFT_457280 [Ochromonadaceae sp. CCMP2298]